MFKPANGFRHWPRQGGQNHTLIKTIMGLVQPRAVQCSMTDRTSPIFRPERAEMGIGYVPEGRHVYGQLTVERTNAVALPKPRVKEKLKKNIEMVYDISASR